MSENLFTEYQYIDSNPTWSNNYLWEPLQDAISQYPDLSRKVFEIGCGSGATAKHLSDLGFDVTGIDPSKSRIELANSAYPELKLFKVVPMMTLPGNMVNFLL